MHPERDRSLRRERRFAFFARALLAAATLAAPGTSRAAAVIASSTTFAPADATRTYLDRGGVWNGTTEVTATTGDTLQFTLCNTAPNAVDRAFDLTSTVTLPAGFSYVPGTIAGIPGIGASQAGVVLSVGIPANTDVTTGTCRTIGFGVTVSSSVTAGTYPVGYAVGWGTTDGATDGSSAFIQNLLVESGAATITKSPSTQLQAVGDSAAWTVTVTNTGGGGLFAVSVDETAINPGPSLSFSTITQTAPPSPPSAASAAKRTLPYLSAGQAFVLASSAVVTGCSNIDNLVYLDDRSHVSSQTASASVVLDFKTPLVDFAAPAITLSNLTTTHVSVTIDNTGRGAAKNVVLATTLPGFSVAVTSVTAGWAYDAASGSFTKTGSGGTIANAASDTLQFDVAPAGAAVCTPPAGGLYFLTGRYTDVCGNPYTNPVRFNNLSSSYSQPGLTLSEALAGQIVTPTSTAGSTVTISIARPDLLATNPIVVVDTLPANVTSIVLGSLSGGQTATCPGGTCDPGEAVTWTIPKPAGSGTVNYTLPMTFSIPAFACADNQTAVNVSTVGGVSLLGCGLSSNASATAILTNTVSSGVVSGYYNQAYAVAGGVHETGLVDDGDGVREPGEGEFIAVFSTYTFPGAFAGTWAGSFFSDNFAGVSTMTLVRNSLTVAWDGGAPVAVPAASVTQFLGGLRVNAAFLAGGGFVNSASLAGHSIRFDYKTTVTDDALGATVPTSLGFFSDFDIAGATGACTGGSATRIIQYSGAQIARAVETAALSIPSVVDVCGPFTATMTVTGSNFDAYKTSAAVLTASSYSYISPQTPVYGGAFNAGNVVYTENGGVNPSFLYTPANFTGTGTVGVVARRNAAASTNNSSLSVSGSYDDWQTDVTAPRDFATGASASPVLTREGRLNLTTTPQAVSVSGRQVSWVIYATDAGSGGLYGVDIRNVVPPGLTINVSSTNAQNPNFPVSVVGATATWNQTTGAAPIDVAAGGGIALTVVADVTGGTCTIAPDANVITGRWGCGGVDHELLTKTDPDFSFPAGGLQATHDSVNTFTRMCSSDYDTIIIRNTGLLHIFDAKAYEVLEPSVTGVDIVTGTVQVSTNAGATWTPLGAAGDPLGTGTAADPYVWRSTEVPQLADIAPLGETGGYSSVRVRVQVRASELTNGLIPQVTSKATGSSACGQAFSDPGTPFTLVVRKPAVTTTKTGRNLTAGGGYAGTVYGGQGDVVEWKVVVQNAGLQQAEHLRLLDLLPSDGGAATVSGPGITGSPALTSGFTVPIATLTASNSATYLVTETLGASCVADVNTANASWGCTEKANGLRSALNAPTASTGTAALVMYPVFSGASSSMTFTTLPNGRAEVTAHFVNTGGTALGLVVYSTIPAGFLLDSASTPSFTTDGGVVSMTSGGSYSAPSWTFGGSLRNAKFLDLKYRVIQTGAFDVTTSSFTSPETVGAGTDPAPPAGGLTFAEIDFQSTCGGASSHTLTGVFDPKTPDVDLSVSPSSKTLADGATQNFDWTLTNNGDAGSLASHVGWRLASVGPGWTVNSVTVLTPGAGGTGGACAANVCDGVQIGTIAAAASAIVRVNATANDNGGALSLVGEAEGSLFDDAGVDTLSDYSLDQAAPKVVGVTVSKSLVATSESFTSTGTLAVGEEATFRLRARWFGGADISTITVRDTLPTGMGYVAHSTTTGHDLAVPTATGNVPVTAGTIDFSVPAFSGSGTFVVDLVARALNNAFNVNGRVNTNNLGAKFDAIGRTYASNSASDGFGGTEAALHASTTTTVVRPTLAFDKQVKNVTTGSAFAQSGAGHAGDTLEYRVTVLNNGGAPAFDLAVNDVLATPKLLMTDGATDGIDNDGDGAVDDATEGGYTAVAGGTVTFVDANTALASGAGFARLDPGQTITLRYRSQIDVTAAPNDSLLNATTVFATTLPGLNGSQTLNPGVQGSASGESVVTSTDSAAVVITTISFSKSLVTTSQGADASTNVVVGEQLQFQVALVLPAGTVPSFKVFDHLPAGLRLVLTPAVTLGSAISPVVPTITPGALPVDGADMTWDFGTVTVASNTTQAQRTVTIPYVAQVRNVAGNVNAATLINSSSYTYVGSPPVNGSTVTVVVREPAGVVSFAMGPASGFDAGKILVATVTVSNAGGTSTAYDLNLAAFLPVGLAYVPGTTVGFGGPAIGEPEIGVSSLTWGRAQAVPQDVDVTTSAPLQFRIGLLVTDAARPSQPLGVTVVGDWTSLDGSPGPNLGFPVGTTGATDGERSGTGTAPNAYRGVASATSTVTNAFTVAKSSSGSALSDGSFRVGDLVTYTLTLGLQEGSVDNYRISDVLPAGLAFDSFDPVTPASGATVFAYAAPAASSAPTAGATGTLTWYFGTVKNQGDNNANNDALTLVYRARVLDAGGIAVAPTVKTLVNSALARWNDFAASAQVSSVAASTVTVKQPSLTFSKSLRAGQPVTVAAGAPVAYRATVTNAGGGPAYDLRLADTLPVGLRATTPVVSSATLNGVGVTLTQSYASATGALSWDLTDAQVLNGSVSGSTLTLVVDYDVAVDSAAGGGLTLTNSALVPQYFSQPATSPTERRQYAATASSQATVNTPLPTGIAKTVDQTTASIGGVLTYTISVPSAPATVALYDVRIQDALPAGLTLGGLSHNGGILAPGACGSVVVTNNTVGNALDVTYGCLPPGTQAVIVATATVRNVAGNQETTTVSNGASFTWAKTPAGATQAAISTSTINTLLREPHLSIDKTLVSVSTASAAQGLQAGDKARYRIKIVNSPAAAGGGDAHDLLIFDAADANLTAPAVTALPDNPGAPANLGTVGGVTTFRWSVPGPLAAGATYQFDVEFTLGVGVQPLQTLVNGSSVTWTSQPATPPQERDGSGGINDYAATDPTPVSIVVGPVHVEKAVKAPGDSTYAVGEDATFRLDFIYGQGTVNSVHLIDALPAGLVFSTATVSVSSVQRAGGGAVTFTGPAPGALGSLDFDVGSLESTGSTPTVHLDVTARVRDVVGNVDATGLTNGVSATLVSSTGGVVAVSPMNPLPTITVVEPKLAVAFDGPPGGTMDLGSASTYTVRAKNVGTSEAFQPVLQVALASGMRKNSPASLPTTAAISGGRALALVAGTDYAVAYSSTTGVMSFTFTSTNSFVAVGETLTAGLLARLDDDASNAVVLRSTAAATTWYSRDASAGAAAETRTTVKTLVSANGGIADGGAIAPSDDHGDDAAGTVRAPVVSMTKSVTPTSAALPFDTTLAWTVQIANGGAIATAGSAFTDDLGAFVPTSQYISSSTLSSATVVGAPGGFVDSSNANGGTNNRGQVTLTNLLIPAASTVTVSFSVRITTVIPNGTKIYNRATISVPGFTNPVLSDSNRPADDDAVEAGNNPGVPNDDDPTVVTINSAPGFDFDKTAVDDSGAPLVAGDTVTYTLKIRNRGTERSLTTVVTDAAPAQTSYVPGTTMLNGVGIADSAGASALATGMPVNTPGEAAGVLAVYSGTQEAVITFKVRLSTGVAAGSSIPNQASLSGLGEGTSTPISRLSDDPGTAPSPDPTVVVVSGAAVLVSEKTVADDDGGFTLAGDTVTYTVTVRNIGDVAARSVVLSDLVSSSFTYVPGSILYDADGSSPTLAVGLTDAADADKGDFGVTASTKVTVSVATVAAHAEFSVSFRARVKAGIASGTAIPNQASITGQGLPTVLSDGNGSHSDGDQPTWIVIGAAGAAALRQTKQVIDLNGGTVDPGDQLEYLITTYNVGNSTATNVTVTDPLPPAFTAYSTGTTTSNGVVVPDAGLVSSLVAGRNVGSLNPGAVNYLRFRVRVSSTAPAGSTIDNQASFTANGGALTGVSDSDLDDGVESGNLPGDPNDDDPTRVQVGGAPGSAIVSGRVWQDMDHDHVYGAGDNPQPGWKVEVLRGGVVVASQVVGADGTYRIANLVPGPGYQIRFRHPTTNVVYGKARSSHAGVDLTDGTIRSLTLQTGENVLNQNLPLDPNGVLYDSITRQPVAGAQVFLDGPVGFTPALHLLPGQDGQVTGPTGFYAFDINFAAGAPFGVYTLRFASPAGYLTNLPATPSTIIGPDASSPLCLAANCLDVPLLPDPFLVQAQAGAPAALAPTDYYLRFQFDNLADAAVVNNHVPLDPILDNAIFVTKTADRREVSRGDMVVYTVTARNNVAAALINIKLHDLIPAGFKYRLGSATLAGAAAEPSVTGRVLEWTGLSFAANETKTFKMLMIVGSGVGEGRYTNQAWAINTVVNARVSNVGEASVVVVPDPTFDCADLLGKVFDDKDANGWQDQGEPGLPNVRLATARGWLVQSDAEGRFHIACADAPNEERGSDFIMKVDEQSLPTGYRVTTENPRVVHLTRGKASKIEFGASLFRVVRLDLEAAAFGVEPVRASAEKWVEVEDATAIPPIRFKVAKFAIEPEHIEAVRDALERVRALPDARRVRLLVVGHTDAAPIVGRLKETIADNWALSRSRAEGTAAMLREKLGLAPDVTKTDGKADTVPLASNATPEGRALNRRVEVKVIYERRDGSASAAPAVSTAAAAGASAPRWREAVRRAVSQLERAPSVLRLGYCRRPGEKIEEVRHRLWQVSQAVRAEWPKDEGRYPLSIETETDGTACAGDVR